ncbi:hypothetical protein AB834_00080 [PVC group bacterium (ex Bugula neritina AB1)]|nr:hypothetical protein AB834_00080 [PVC group bacterium (ex Bugula neritina AB1)]
MGKEYNVPQKKQEEKFIQGANQDLKKKKPLKKPKKITITFSEEEYEKLKEKSSGIGLGIATYIRSLIYRDI